MKPTDVPHPSRPGEKHGRVLDWATAYEGGKGWTKVVSYLKKGDPAALAAARGYEGPRYQGPQPHGRDPAGLQRPGRRGTPAVHAMAAIKAFDAIGTWLDKALTAEGPDRDIFGAVAAEVRGQGVGTRELLAPTSAVVRDGRPTSAGRPSWRCPTMTWPGAWPIPTTRI